MIVRQLGSSQTTVTNEDDGDTDGREEEEEDAEVEEEKYDHEAKECRCRWRKRRAARWWGPMNTANDDLVPLRASIESIDAFPLHSGPAREERRKSTQFGMYLVDLIRTHGQT